MSSTYINSDPELGDEDTKAPLKGECSYSNQLPDGKAQLNCNFKSSTKSSKNGNLSSRSDDDDLGRDTTEGSILPGSGTDLGFRTPIPAGPIIELRGREVIFAILVFLFLSVSIGLIVVLASNKVAEIKEGKKLHGGGQRQAESGQKLCLNEHCLRTALSMMEKMDTTANPCEDFWQYACGGYVTKHEIPPAQKTWGVDKEVELNIETRVKKILESPVSEGSDENSAEWKLKTVYKRCMDTDKIDELGARPLLEIIDRVGGWAVLESWNIGARSGKWNYQTFLQELHFDFNTAVFFHAYLAPDDKASHIDMLQFDQGGLGLRESYYLGNSSHRVVVAYKEYMRSIAEELGARPADVESFVDQTYRFETELAKLFGSDEDRMNSYSLYNKLTIAELQAKSPRINWQNFVNYKYSAHFKTEDVTVLVTNVTYMSEVSKLIARTDERVLNYYMVWRFIESFAIRLLSTPFREIRQTFLKKYKGTKKSPERYKECMGIVNEWFGMGISSLYVKHHFDDSSKKDILSIAGYIRRAFDENLQQAEWMDKNTSKAAVEKLEAMEVDIGYPDFILNTTQVNDLYHMYQFSEEDSYFQMDVKGIKYEMDKNIRRLNGIPDKYEVWGMNPTEVNAFYSPAENKIGFPVVLFQSPYYSPKAPNYINFGAIGSTIGHEMTHGFDDSGAMFDKNGNLHSWWGMESHARFMDKTKCVADYFSGLSIDGKMLDGMSTLGENIAEIGGLKQSYQGYLRWEKEHGKEDLLPGLDIDNHQAFFLSYAQNWCVKRRKKNLKSALQYSRHSPGELRVNGTLSQIKWFAEVYGCSSRSPMNPPDKCHVW